MTNKIMQKRAQFPFILNVCVSCKQDKINNGYVFELIYFDFSKAYANQIHKHAIFFLNISLIL